MRCPFCSKEALIVVNSRPTKSLTQIWRRKKCLNCKEIITTYEKIDLSYLHVVKSDGRVQMFQRSKLFSGIYQASLQKKNMDRGDRGMLTDKITSKIEERILSKKAKRISSKEIREMVLEYLIKEDPNLFMSFLAYFSKSSIKDLKGNLTKYLNS